MVQSNYDQYPPEMQALFPSEEQVAAHAIYVASLPEAELAAYGTAYHSVVDRSAVHFMTQVIEHKDERIQQLTAEATRNPVTGLYNEIGFAVRLAEIRAAYPDVPVAIIEIDLGKFKSINDTLGHTMGDTVLRAVGGHLRQSDAETLVAHPHGDEFRIAAPLLTRETTTGPELSNQEKMNVIIDRTKRVGNQLCANHPSLKDLGFSISAGGAILEPGMDLDEVIPVADANMYADKAAGNAEAFRALPLRKRLAHHVGSALFRFSGTQPPR